MQVRPCACKIYLHKFAKNCLSAHYFGKLAATFIFIFKAGNLPLQYTHHIGKLREKFRKFVQGKIA